MSEPVAIVTGGSRGIGAEIVRRLAHAGHHVLLVYSHNEDDAVSTARQCETQIAKVIPFKCNIAVPDAPGLIFHRAGELGDPMVLVNNAGITGRISRLEDADEDAIQQAIDVNLTATIMLCREAMRHWADSRNEMPRSIVNVSSIAAKTGAPEEYVWYAAAKAGVNALTTGLALEAARHGIRVNAVSPGTTATTIHARALPEEVATAVVWLTSAEASYVNGAILDVTGGIR